ncbi:MAG: iron-containing redox enzyme family protein [Vitreimonas sp.]
MTISVLRESAPLAFDHEQKTLARFNRMRMRLGLGEDPRPDDPRLVALECAFVKRCRQDVAALLEDMPDDVAGFMPWFESIAKWGPGQHDPLFVYLAERANLEEMRWFLLQEVAGEAGFEDLVALAQIKMPVQAKLEMARNYWDEMGRGQEKGMHGPMLERLARHLGLCPDIDNVVPESLSLGNMMMALGAHRAFSFHLVGALGIIEMTAPDRAQAVTQGLKRLGVDAKARHYFALHAVLDRKHSADWNREVIEPLVREDFRRARCLAEGALLRLDRGRACFERYRRHFGLVGPRARAANTLEGAGSALT